MINNNLEYHFAKIGAKVKVRAAEIRWSRTRDRVSGRTAWRKITPAPVQLDVTEGGRQDEFDIVFDSALGDRLEVIPMDVRPDDRHLLLLARIRDEAGNVTDKYHFLCGHDERHLFVASVHPVTTVAQAKASLKPIDIREREVGLKAHKRNRRKTDNFRRQGEWFFVPVDIDPHTNLIRRYEPLVRGPGSKAHIAQYAYRSGGEQVKVCNQYPLGLTKSEYKAVIAANPRAAHFNWRDMVRNASVYVKGTIRHPDHATIVLPTWHTVYMNTERPIPGKVLVFLD